MPKKPANHGTDWTPAQVVQLRNEAAGNTPTPVIAIHLKRTPAAVQAKAEELRLSLKPTNQSPYGTRRK